MNTASNKLTKKQIALSLVLLFMVVATIGYYLVSRTSVGDLMPFNSGNKEDYTLPAGTQNPILTVDFYCDFTNSACYDQLYTLMLVKDNLPNDISIQYYHSIDMTYEVALHAAIASEVAANDGNFWAYALSLYENSWEWTEVDNKDVLFADYASNIGYNFDEFLARFNDAKSNTSDEYKRVTKSAKESEGKAYTSPTILINGERMEMPVNYETLESIILKNQDTDTSLAPTVVNDAPSNPDYVEEGINYDPRETDVF